MKKIKIQKRILFFAIVFFFIFIQINALAVDGNLPGLKLPETVDEAHVRDEMARKAGEIEVKKSWNEAINIWTKMYRWGKNFWQKHIQNKLLSFWNKIKKSFFQNLKFKKGKVETEFEKDKKLMEETTKEKTTHFSKSIWQRIKDKIKDKMSKKK